MSGRGPLDYWQGRLETHFRELASTRQGSKFPFFVLEHGLADADLKIIPQVLDHQIRSGIPVITHWLVWAVYAAENGYGYDGHEYWHSFENGMPRWRDYGRPGQLRIIFRKFRQQFSGFEPTGRWAGHFKNICWPITHAILPKYFQAQFAKAMYDARHELARMSEASPEEAGALLARNAWYASSRFQEFLEQPELAGRIVQAMLGRSGQGESPISESTLARIVTDLTKTRDAREWLKATREEVNDNMRGVYRPRPGDSVERADPQKPLKTSRSFDSIRPTLLLRHSDSTTWTPVIEVPSFDEIARLSPELTRFLQTTRCTLAGTGGIMLPAGWTLYGSQRRVLKAWPTSESVLISFEKSDGVLDNILKSECRLSPGPIWLFRVGADGIGREMLNRNVRPGQRYVVLSRTALTTNLSFAKAVPLACDLATGLELELPEKIEQHEANELQRLGIQVSRNIIVWPAGPCVQNWDGEGHGDWLSTDEPCLGIFHDHHVEQYVITVNNGREVRIEGAAAGRSIFVRLPRLQPGRHTIAIRPIRVGISPHQLRELEGRIDLNVRDPKPRKLGTSAHSGLVVSVDPPNPSLAEFWDGTARLSVLGPEGREVRCSISLEGAGGATLLQEDIGRASLPTTSTQWLQRIRRFTDNPKRAWTYLDATKGRFVIKADELGEFVLRLERSTTPLRWMCRFDQQTPQLRLIDDTGSETPAVVRFHPFKQPAAGRELLIEEAAHAHLIDGAGGLYCASQDTQQDLIVVSSGQSATSFNELQVHPDLRGAEADIPALLRCLTLWQGARLAGPLAEYRRTHVVASLLDCFYAQYCGTAWVQLEGTYGEGRDHEITNRLKQAVDGRQSFAAALQANHSRLARGMKEGRAWFFEVANRYGISSDHSMCGFALQFATSPSRLYETYGTQLVNLLERAKQFPSLLRGARFLALLSLGAEPNTSNIRLPRWQW